MKSIKLNSHVEKDGILKLEMPTGLSDVDVEVIIVIQPIATAKKSEKRGWPPGFFEHTIGAWKGELARAPQGEYEEREPLD